MDGDFADIEERLRSTGSRERKAEILFEELYDSIVHFLQRKVNHEELAEDLASETFRKILGCETLDVSKPYKAVRSFVYTTADNLFKNWLRDSSRDRVFVFSDRSEKRHKKGYSRYANQGDASYNNGPDRLAKEVLEGHRGEIVEGLPELYREAWKLRELEGMKYKEIAEDLGIPLGTVKSRISRAYKEVRAGMMKHPDVQDYFSGMERPERSQMHIEDGRAVPEREYAEHRQGMTLQDIIHADPVDDEGTYRMVRRSLNRLEERDFRQSVLFTLFHYRELSYGEIAEKENMSVDEAVSGVREAEIGFLTMLHRDEEFKRMYEAEVSRAA